MLLGRNIDDVDASTLQALVDASATESVHLEFKRDSYGNSDAAKKEFLKDVASFANTLGGHLIIGIDEVDGSASGLTPLSGVDVDAEVQRLENIVRTGLEPAIVGRRMKRVDVGGGSCIVVHVPRSFNPPHRVILKNSNRYYARNSAGVHELSVEELRALFGEQRSIEERARTFIGERFLRIQGNDPVMPIPVSDGVILMHLVPLPDLGAERRLDVTSLRSEHKSFSPIGADHANGWRYNVDGYCRFRDGPVCHGYTQVFRNGSLEATSASLIRERDGYRRLHARGTPEKLIAALNRYMQGLRSLESTPPILVQLTAINVKGVRLVGGDDYDWHSPPPLESGTVHLPSSLVSEFCDGGNYESVIAEQMHTLWNAFDLERCPYFDESGRWVGA